MTKKDTHGMTLETVFFARKSFLHPHCCWWLAVETLSEKQQSFVVRSEVVFGETDSSIARGIMKGNPIESQSSRPFEHDTHADPASISDKELGQCWIVVTYLLCRHEALGVADA